MAQKVSFYGILTACPGTGAGWGGVFARSKPWSPCAVVIFFLWLILVFGCSSSKGTPPAKEAFVARNTVGLWKELVPEAPVIATLNLGERVEIVGRRRRFLEIRNATGHQGWTHESMLVTSDVRELMRQLQNQTASDPSQGTVFSLHTLNVHIEPHRWAPTIFQLKKDEGATLLRHRLVERIPYRPEKKKPPPTPTGRDDWYLVRVAGGQAGWILTTGVYSGVPDEIKQFAEGHRVTSYFSLVKITDPKLGKIKETWLWTQTEKSKQPHDFDLIRVFTWIRQSRSYRTIKLERGLVGYLPVLIHHNMTTRWGNKTGFSIDFEKHGKRLRQKYALMGNKVRKVGDEVGTSTPAPIKLTYKNQPPTLPLNFRDRIFDWWKKLTNLRPGIQPSFAE